MADYDHKAIEKKWQEKWERARLYETPDTVSGKENFYALVEFPYPSGDLHVGHWDAFAVPDIFVRMKRMQGYNVLFPFGYDAFGLPAENAAIKRNINPIDWIAESVTKMRAQMKTTGNAFDWNREINTSSPEYYKWTQWLFLKLYEKGLAYRGKGLVNWCPNDQTVLANEQVIDGKCERCDAVVEQKELEQWFFKITDYADRLIDDLDGLNWPEPIKESQRNWIGRSEGAEIDFGPIKVFTTRPDTIFGATYVVLAPEHPLVKNYPEASSYVAAAKEKSEIERTAEGKEKSGVKLNLTVKNPATGEELPVWVADYVLGHYGTGAVMAVPAHDTRDYEFAKKYGLSIKQVLEPTYYQTTEPGKIKEGEPFKHREAVIAIVKHWSEEKYAALKWKEVAWGTFVTGGIEEGQTPESAALAEIVEETGYTDAKFIKEFGVVHAKFYHVPKKENRCAHGHVVYFELQSDARNVVDEKEQTIHDVLWLSKDELKKFLTPDSHLYCLKMLSGESGPYTDFGTLINSGKFDRMESSEVMQKITEFVGGTLVRKYKVRDWLVSRQRYWGAPIPIVYDPEGKAHAIPDEHLPWLLPEDADIKPKGTSPLGSSKELVERTERIFGKGWRPETDTMDGFVDNSWYFFRYLDPHNPKEFSSLEKQKLWMPIKRYSGGAEHTTVHVLYSRFFTKVLYDMGLSVVAEPYEVRLNRGIILAEDGRKMSKRWGNTVNPDEHVANVGADSVRTYLAFIGPYNVVGSFPWSTNGLIGVRKFLERVVGLGSKVTAVEMDQDITVLLNQTIKKVEDDIESMKFNTSVSQLMIFSNALGDLPQVPRQAYETLLRLLAPFAPHITEELWEKLGHGTSIHLELWPTYDSAKLTSETVTIAIQVAGKLRGTVEVLRGAGEETVLEAAKNTAKIKAYLPGMPSKTIFVKDRILNLIP